jgi:hypothetical protein
MGEQQSHLMPGMFAGFGFGNAFLRPGTGGQ